MLELDKDLNLITKKTGIFYNPVNEELMLITSPNITRYYDTKTKVSTKLVVYDFEHKHGKIYQVLVTNCEDLVYIGKL